MFNKNIKNIVFVLFFLVACNTENQTDYIGAEVLGKPNYKFENKEFLLDFKNIKVNAVETQAQRAYLLGQNTKELFGKTNIAIVSQLMLAENTSVFGSKSAKSESNTYDEAETVEKVSLYLPFFSERKEKLNDQDVLVSHYQLNSIFGDKTASFEFLAHQLTYFLSSVDVQFENKKYFSDFDIASKLGQELVNKRITISNNPIVRYNFDLEDTSIDESKQEQKTLTPGIYVELDKTFFQVHLLDKEGSDELKNNKNFVNYLKGIVFSTSNFSKDFMALINLEQAKIYVDYSYKVKLNNREFLKRYSTYELGISGITFNKYQKIDENVSLSDDEIFLESGQGYVAEIQILKEQLKEFKENKILINHAEILLYVKEENEKMPQYLGIYNAKTGLPLIDFATDTNSEKKQTVLGIGVLKKNEKGENYYLFRITDQIVNALKLDENINLGICIISENTQNVSRVIEYKTKTEGKKTWMGNILTPYSVVLFGKGNSQKHPQLKIYYSQVN